MKPVTQSRVGANGRCFNACLASILELPEKQVPDFADNGFEKQVDDFLKPYGVYYRDIPLEMAPVGYHIVTGRSPRGGIHAVVGHNGKIVHDPHPHDGTGRGLVSVDSYGLLLRRFN